MRTLLFSGVILLISFCAFSQSANLYYEVKVSSAGIFSTEGDSWSTCSCQESGNEEYVAKIAINHSGSNGTDICLTCSNNGNCNYGQGTVLRTVSNTTVKAFTVDYEVYENDGGSMCSYDSGDDCHTSGSFNYNFYYEDFYGLIERAVYSCGGSIHKLNLSYKWKYVGTSSAITPTCSDNYVSYSSGDIRQTV